MKETNILKIPLKDNWSFKPTQTENKTASIYNEIFPGYDEKRFEESVELFTIRQKKWGIPMEWFKNKICLDVGCGQGRFVVALGRLGAARVIGVDVNEAGLEAGRNRKWAKELSNIELMNSSAGDLPFLDNYFDYVICSGVLLLMPEPKKGFDELVRVAKPGGRIFLSMYGKGGLKWLTNDFFRFFLKRWIPFKTAYTVFKVIGVPPNKRYNLLDNLYTPYTHRYTETEIRNWFEKAGFENIRRVKFERYDYETLKSRIIHGEGWIQIMADKKKI
ncbi:MAG: class I SAM-dependent methyltransferase [Minisyncoccia bacterium]